MQHGAEVSHEAAHELAQLLLVDGHDVSFGSVWSPCGRRSETFLPGRWSLRLNERGNVVRSVESWQRASPFASWARSAWSVAGRPSRCRRRRRRGRCSATSSPRRTPQPRQRLCDLLWDGPDDPRAALRWSLTKLRPLVDDDGAVRLVADRERVGFEAAGATVDLREASAAPGTGRRVGQHRSPRVAPRRRCGATSSRGSTCPTAIASTSGAPPSASASVRCASRCSTRWSSGSSTHRRKRRCVTRGRGSPSIRSRTPRTRRPSGSSLASGRNAEAQAQVETCRRILERELGGRRSPALELARMEIGKKAAVHEATVLARRRCSEGVAPARRSDARRPGRRALRPRGPRAPRAREPRRRRGAPLGRAGHRQVSPPRRAGGAHEGGRRHRARGPRLRGGVDATVRDLDRHAARRGPDRPGRSAAPAPRAALSRARRGADRRGVQGAPVRRRRARCCAPRRRARRSCSPSTICTGSTRRRPGSSHYVARVSVGTRWRSPAPPATASSRTTPAALRFVRALRRDGHLRTLPVTPLGVDDTRALVRAAVGPGVDGARVFRESGGNPLFALEVARALSARRARGARRRSRGCSTSACCA